MHHTASAFEKLESRVLLSVKTVDFDNYPVRFDYLNWLSKDSHTLTSGFSYTLGTGNGQRPNVNGITWADQSYYDVVLGSGGFNSVNTWNMKPTILYADQKNGNWLTSGWNYVQDMAEGAVCVDDNARIAVALADDYLLNGTESSYQLARDALTWVSYMTTRQGKTYNFAWLDAPAIFGWDSIQAQDKHYQYRSEYVKRTQYPSASPNGLWFDPNSDTSRIINYPNPVRAQPFMSHAKYSVYVDDLRSASNADVAQVYDGPLYTTAAGGITSYKTGIKKNWTNSTQAFGFDEARAIMALTKGMNMMQKRSALAGGLTGDDLTFAKFLENNTNRLLKNLRLQNVSGFDSKIGSAILSGLTDYYQLLYGTTEYGTYSPLLPANANTAETTDDRPLQADVLTMIDQLATEIQSTQYRTSDWRNGIFIEDAGSGYWDAWGQLQIHALSRTYQMKISTGADPANPAVSSLLDYAAYAADNFYGVEAYHYAVPGTSNVRTKERITGISGWGASYHTNSDQIAYHNSTMVLGLRNLAKAFEVSDRADKTARMATYLNGMKSVASWFIGNNTALIDMYDGASQVSGTFRGMGTFFDGIGGGTPSVNRNAGGESQAEGLWAIIHAKAAIEEYALSSTFTFETGTSGVAAPTVTSSVYDFDAAVPTLRFFFSQNVGATVDPFDLTITHAASGDVIAPADMSIGYNATLRRMDVTFPGLPSGILADGDYTATIAGSGIVGLSGNPMAANHTFPFFALGGDANRTRTVDSADFNAMLLKYGSSGAVFSEGDFSYDGKVNSIDFNILANAFGRPFPSTMPVATPGMMPLARAAISSPFNQGLKSLFTDVFDDYSIL